MGSVLIVDDVAGNAVLVERLLAPGGHAVRMAGGGGEALLKVLHMYGYSKEAILKRGVLDASVAFLHKPFTAQALALKVRHTLDR